MVKITKNMAFKQDSAAVDRKLSIIQKACILGLALTSVFVLFQMGKGFFTQLVESTFWIIVLTNIVVVLYMLAIDFGLSTFLPWTMVETLREKKDGEPRQRKAFTLLLGVVCAVQILVTGSLTFLASDDISQMSIAKPDQRNYIELTQNQKSTYEETLAIFKEDIHEAKQAIKEAENQKAELLKAAIFSQGNEMARLYYDKKDKWAKKQLKSAITKAERKGEKLISKAKAHLSNVEAERRMFIQESKKVQAAALSPVAKLTEFEANLYQEKVISRTSLFRYLSIFFVFGFIVFTWLRSLYTVSITDEPHDREKGFTDVVNDAIGRLKKNLVKGVDSSLMKISFFDDKLRFQTAEQLPPTTPRFSIPNNTAEQTKPLFVQAEQPNRKPKQKIPNSRTVVVQDKKTFAHQKEGGGIDYMTLKGCVRTARIYFGRLKNAIEKRNWNSVETNQKVLYWLEAIGTLNEQMERALDESDTMIQAFQKAIEMQNLPEVERLTLYFEELFLHYFPNT